MENVMGENGDSPAGKAMSEAIELAIAEESPYPEAAFFIDADTPYMEREMARASDWGYAAVLCFADGSVQVIPSSQPVSRPAGLPALPELRH
jgi:hypothetical protein